MMEWEEQDQTSGGSQSDEEVADNSSNESEDNEQTEGKRVIESQLLVSI